MTKRILSLVICLVLALQGALALNVGSQYRMTLDGKLSLFVENGS